MVLLIVGFVVIVEVFLVWKEELERHMWKEERECQTHVCKDVAITPKSH
jgi:hypothetical protein